MSERLDYILKSENLPRQERGRGRERLGCADRDACADTHRQRGITHTVFLLPGPTLNVALLLRSKELCVCLLQNEEE